MDLEGKAGMGIFKSGRSLRVPRRAALCAAAGLMTLATAAAGTAGASELGFRDPLPERPSFLDVAPAQFGAAQSTDPATLPASRPATLPADSGAAPVMPVGPSTSPFLASPGSSRDPSGSGDAGYMDPSAQGEIVPAEPARGPLTFSVQGLYMFGSLKGIAQTPRGGQLRTTNVNRPKYDEIGIEDGSIADGEFAIGLDPHQQIFAGVQHIHLSSNNVLKLPLISENVSFPARTGVHSDVRLDWYRLGYRYAFFLSTAPNGVPDLTLTPSVDAFYWDYGFSLNGGRIGKVGRSLTKYGFQLGATLAWRPNGGPLSIEASALGFPQGSRIASISQETVLARYRFYRYRNYDFNVLLGVAFEQQSFNDRKLPLSNRVVADFGPMLLTGLQVNF